MTLTDTAQSQSESISLEFEFHHSPEREWRALTDPAQLAEWLLPVVDFKLEPGAAFVFKTQPYPGWDGTVNWRLLDIERIGSSATRGASPSMSRSWANMAGVDAHADPLIERGGRPQVAG